LCSHGETASGGEEFVAVSRVTLREDVEKWVVERNAAVTVDPGSGLMQE
jgi:hypothetical protein